MFILRRELLTKCSRRFGRRQVYPKAERGPAFPNAGCKGQNPPLPLTERQKRPHCRPEAPVFKARVARNAIGAVAQMGERRVRNAKVRGSIPLGSTSIFSKLPAIAENGVHWNVSFLCNCVRNPAPPAERFVRPSFSPVPSFRSPDRRVRRGHVCISSPLPG